MKEKQQVGLTELAEKLHFILASYHGKSSPTLIQVRNTLDSKGRLLFNSYLKKLCTVVPSWIKCREIKTGSFLDVKNWAMTTLDLTTLINTYFTGVPTKLYKT